MVQPKYVMMMMMMMIIIIIIHTYIHTYIHRDTQHQQMKERLKKEYSKRLRMILKSELNARNKITAIGALAVPVLRYSLGIINWRIEEIKKK